MIISAMMTAVFTILGWLSALLPSVGINDIAAGDAIVNAIMSFYTYFRWTSFWFPVDTLRWIIFTIIYLEIIGYFINLGIVIFRLIRGAG